MHSYKKQNASQYIIGYILEQIQQGELKKGDKILTEREFSEKMGVSRIPMREALCALSAMGILESRQGDGTYVSSYNTEVIGQVFYAYAVLEETPLQEIVTVRKSLEAEAARIAAEHVKDEDLNHLRECIECYEKVLEMKPGSKVFEEKLSDADYRFHRAIAQAAHNQYLSQLLSTVTASFRILHEKSYKDDVDHGQESAKKSANWHRQILEAIENHDANKAYKTMYEHLQWIETMAK